MPSRKPRKIRMAPERPKNSIGLRPKRSWNQTESRSSTPTGMRPRPNFDFPARRGCSGTGCSASRKRSEEHTSELQSRLHLVCRLLLEKKKHNERTNTQV